MLVIKRQLTGERVLHQGKGSDRLFRFVMNVEERSRRIGRNRRREEVANFKE